MQAPRAWRSLCLYAASEDFLKLDRAATFQSNVLGPVPRWGVLIRRIRQQHSRLTSLAHGSIQKTSLSVRSDRELLQSGSLSNGSNCLNFLAIKKHRLHLCFALRTSCQSLTSPPGNSWHRCSAFQSHFLMSMHPQARNWELSLCTQVSRTN